MNDAWTARTEPVRDRDREPGRGRTRLTAFFVLACLLSWADWLLVIASDHGRLPFTVGLNPWGSFGPAVAAVAVTAAVSGRRGIGDLLRPLARWRFGWRWWIAIPVGPAVLVTLATVLHAITGGTVLPAASPDYAQLASMFVLLLFLGGPLGEEIGWRGYALPRLLERMAPVPASLVIGSMWLVWHLPLFWLPGSAQEGSSIAVFTGLVFAISILTTWVYIGTGGSLLAAVLFHQFINVCTYFLPTVFPSLASTDGVDLMLLPVAWLAAIIAIVAMRRHSRARPA